MDQHIPPKVGQALLDANALFEIKPDTCPAAMASDMILPDRVIY